MVETLLRFKRMSNGMVFRPFVGELQKLGYVVTCKSLFAPNFGSVSARRRLIITAVRSDEHAAKGDIQYPAGSKTWHPLCSILEPEFFRRDARVGNKRYRERPTPLQRASVCLKQLGELEGRGRGRAVLCPTGFAASQMATGTGPGWTCGLYFINGVVSRLTLREAARTMQIDDHLQLDEAEAVARRQIGNTTPVGMARALGVMCEKYLWKNKKAVTPAKVQGRPLSLTPAGSKQSAEEHDERMQRWQEEDDQLEDGRVELSVLIPRLLQLTDKERECLSRGVRELHNRRWLVLQARRGHEAVEAMRAAGIAAEVVKRAK